MSEKKVTCPCMTCTLYSGDYEDIRNGQYIVHCEDGKARCTTLDAGCAWYQHDEFSELIDVN